MHKETAEVKPRVARGWMDQTATVIAVAGVAAGFAFVNVSADPSPSAEHYADQRALREYVRGALFLLTMIAPLLSLALGLIGRALVGTVAGVAAMAFVLVWVPSHLRACCGGSESSVIGVLRGINNSQQAYASSCANGKYAPTLEALTRPPDSGGAPFLSPTSARGPVYGYAVTMQIPEGAATGVVACNGTRAVSAYFVEAHLIDAIPGRRNFATDEHGTIYSNDDGTVIQPGMAGAEPVQ